jgi:hypothetical protein
MAGGLRPPATEMRQDFLELAILATCCSGTVHARCNHSAVRSRTGYGDGGDAVDRHDFDLHQINLNVFIHNRTT